MTAQQRSDIADDYQTGKFSTDDLAIKYGLSSRKSVVGILRTRNVALRDSGRPRGYTLNENVFDTIGEEQAYWLGFLMADGSVSATRHCLSLGVSERDAAHLEAFRVFMATNRPILIRCLSATRLPFHTLSIDSKLVVDAVSKYGIVPKKTMTAEVNHLENNRHFWRGAVDGDGWLIWDKPKKTTHSRQATLGFCGSNPLVKQFAAFCQTIAPSKSAIYKHGNIYKHHARCRNAALISRELYSDCTIALPRKAITAIEFIDRYV